MVRQSVCDVSTKQHWIVIFNKTETYTVAHISKSTTKCSDSISVVIILNLIFCYPEFKFEETRHISPTYLSFGNNQGDV